LRVWRAFLGGFLLADAFHTIGASFGGWSSFLVAGVGEFVGLCFSAAALVLLVFVSGGKVWGVAAGGLYLLVRAGVVVWILAFRRPLLWLSMAGFLRGIVIAGVAATSVFAVLLLLKAQVHKGRQEDECAQKSKD